MTLYKAFNRVLLTFSDNNIHELSDWETTGVYTWRWTHKIETNSANTQSETLSVGMYQEKPTLPTVARNMEEYSSVVVRINCWRKIWVFSLDKTIVLLINFRKNSGKIFDCLWNADKKIRKMQKNFKQEFK